MIVRGAGSTTLVFNDALFNMPHVPGVQGFVLRHVTQSSGGLRVSRVFRMLAMKDKAAFAADLSALSATPNLRRIIVSHHETLEDEPGAALARVASAL